MNELRPQQQHAQEAVNQSNNALTNAEAEFAAATRELSGARTLDAQIAARARHEAAVAARRQAQRAVAEAQVRLDAVNQDIANAELFRNDFPAQLQTPQTPRPARPNEVQNPTGQTWDPIRTQRHYRDHGAEFPEFSNLQEYVQGAVDFGANPPATAEVLTAPSGDLVIYDAASNTLGIYSPQGTPRTFYRPVANNPNAGPGQIGHRGHRAGSNYEHFLEIGHGIGRRPN
jgi:hypothetical protein